MADLPAAFLENIDWVNQPPPPQARDTHALHFGLHQTLSPPEVPHTLGYQGFMFYRQGEHPTAPITGEQNGLDGTGRAVLNGSTCELLFGDGLPEMWARVQVRFRVQPTPRIFAVVFLHHEGGGGLPGTQVRVVAFDEVEVEPSDGSLRLNPHVIKNNWTLSFTKTTVLP